MSTSGIGSSSELDHQHQPVTAAHTDDVFQHEISVSHGEDEGNRNGEGEGDDPDEGLAESERVLAPPTESTEDRVESPVKSGGSFNLVLS